MNNIVSFAQRLLNENFLGSVGEKYIVETRKLDPVLARNYGAGLADERFLHKMLDAGVTYQQLLDHKLLDLLPRDDDHNETRVGAVPFFLSRGIKIEDIRRYDKACECGGGGAPHGHVMLPYFYLADSITFPIGCLQNPVATIYGRKINFNWSNRMGIMHVWLRNWPPQPLLFNPAALTDHESEVILTEGVMDALTLMQMGFGAASASLAWQSDLLLEVLKLTKKDVALAFDFDGTGCNSANSFMKRWSKLNVSSRIRNLSEEFFACLPGVQNHKDINDWWQHVGHKLQTPLSV